MPILERGLLPLYKSAVGWGPLFAVEATFLPSLAAVVHEPAPALRRQVHRVLFLTAAGIALLAAATVAVLGILAVGANYPVFEMARQVSVLGFLERIEPIFVAMLVTGYFVRVSYYV